MPYNSGARVGCRFHYLQHLTRGSKKVARVALHLGLVLHFGILCASAAPLLSVTRDQMGNQEDTEKAPEATAHVVSALSGDLNGDGKVDCSDLAIVKASFGKRNGQPGFNPRADVNSDGVVDVKDLAFVSQRLPAGTHCP